MKNKAMWKWFVMFLLIAAALGFACSAFSIVWLGHSDTVTGFVTNTRTDYPCLQGNGCAQVNYVEIDGEEYQYLDNANDSYPFTEIQVGDRVIATTQGFEFSLPFNVRVVHPEIVDLKQVKR